MWETSKKHIVAWTALAVMYSMAAGCATTAPVQEAPQAPAPEDEAEAVAVDEAPADQLPDNLDGFIIMETAGMTEPDRKAFDDAVALMNTGAYDQAIEILETLVTHSPGVSAPYVDLGIAYARTNQVEKAEAQFKKALELVPGHPVAGNECGLLLRKKGRFDEARTLYEQVLAGYPNYYPVHRNLGILCDIYLGDLESAMDHYQTYSQAMPEDEQVRLWIADLRTRLDTR